jgi:RNA polymerase sigma-70 factor (ECF subfamily)
MAAQREIGRVLERAIGNLPEPFRVVFVMRDVEEMSTEETATSLGLRLETVRTRLYRARRLLRSALNKEFRSALKDRFPFADVRCARTKKILLAQLDLAAPTPRGTSPPS